MIIRPFRYWCHKVLPLVYDNSLSYYELLNKVVAYLNKVIESNNDLVRDLETVRTALHELEEYVEHYFDNLDLQDEVNKKLDEMAQSGELAVLLKGLIKYEIITVDCKNRAACNIIKNADGHYFLIDFGDEDSAGYIVDAIEQNNCLVMDGCILTHAHHDHVGNYAAILGSVTLASDFVAYTQERPVPGTITQSVLDDYDAFCTYIEQTIGKLLVIPNGNTEYYLSGAKIDFYNTNTRDYYLEPTVVYNDTSLSGNINLGGVNVGFYGDCYYTAEKNITKENVGKQEVLIAPHHGIATSVDRDFLLKTQPDYILCNTGSEYVSGYDYSMDYLCWNSAILGYCDERKAMLIDTESNGSYVVDLWVNGSITTEAIPTYYPQVIKNYASLRDACNLDSDDTISSSTGIKDILLRMPMNSKVTFYCTNNYQLAVDLGLTSFYSWVEITKFTGGSTNALFNRTVEDRFMFTIKVMERRDGIDSDVMIGEYHGEDRTWRIYSNRTNDQAFITVGTTGTLTLRIGYDPTLFELNNNQLNFKRTGYYDISVEATDFETPVTVTIGNRVFNVPNGGIVRWQYSMNAGLTPITVEDNKGCAIFIKYLYRGWLQSDWTEE